MSGKGRYAEVRPGEIRAHRNVRGTVSKVSFCLEYKRGTSIMWLDSCDAIALGNKLIDAANRGLVEKGRYYKHIKGDIMD